MLKLRHVLPFALAFACLDQICTTMPRLHEAGVYYIFGILAPLLAVGGCLWRARIMVGRARGLWVLLAAGLASWTCGMALAAWAEQVQHLPFEIASLADFAYFFYGIPILFALSTPVDGIRSPFFRWLDGIQAIFAGFLGYVTIFGVLPFSSKPVEPLTTSMVVLTYNLENLLLAVCCLVRLLAAPKGGEEWRFYRILCAYLVTYGVGVSIYNNNEILTGGHTTSNLLVDAPMLMLGMLIFTMPRQKGVTPAAVIVAARKSMLALFIDNVSPVLFTLALLALGTSVLSQHFHLGIIAICVALAVYAVRTTILQIRYRETQLELQEARDRLEEISLQDELTGIANRRCFDRTLEAEWRRAARTRDPLSLLLIDLDYFKQINDRFGHPYGDRCLTEVARALRSVASRSGDLVARYGGEEFAVILPVTTPIGAEALAVQMQEAVRAAGIVNESEVGRLLTISVGIAHFLAPESGSPGELIEAADQALYRAKLAGRDRIEHGSMKGLEQKGLEQKGLSQESEEGLTNIGK